MEKKEFFPVGWNLLHGQFYLEHLALNNLEETWDLIWKWDELVRATVALLNALVRATVALFSTLVRATLGK